MVGQWERRTGHAKFPTPYVHAVVLAGGRARVLNTFHAAPGLETPADFEVSYGLDPTDPSPLAGAAGLLLPGGGDIDPAWYGRAPHPRTHGISHRRDRFEMTLLAEALRRDLPVFAICKGMQLLNVALGGTLDQHLADDPDQLDHDRDQPRPDPVHKLRIDEASLLGRILGVRYADVNSHHHQGLDDLPEGLVPVAWAEDGVLEAVELASCSWVVGVQWHPEVTAPLDDLQLDLFRAFVDAAARFEHGGEVSARSA